MKPRSAAREPEAGFATLPGGSVRTLQEWEQGRPAPSGAARRLLSRGRKDSPGAARIAACEKAKGLSAEAIWADVNLAAYANLGQADKAEAAKAEVQRRQPDLTIAAIRNGDTLHPDYIRLADAHYYCGLRKAGFPEK
jgi:hypothetical protein